MFEQVRRELQSSGAKVVSVRTIHRHYNAGAKLAMIAGAGSVYLLIILACARIKTRLLKLSGTMISAMAKLIRRPDGQLLFPLTLLGFEYSSKVTDTAAGRMIRTTIIPAVALLRAKYPISFDVLFTESFIAAGTPASSSLDCTDIAGSDYLFDSFYYEYVTFPSLFGDNAAHCTQNLCKTTRLG